MIKVYRQSQKVRRDSQSVNQSLSVSLSVCKLVSLTDSQPKSQTRHPIGPALCLSVCVSVSLSVCQSVSVSLPVSVSLVLSVSVCLCVCLSVCLCVCLPVSVCLCLPVSVCQSVCLCLSVCLSFCLSVSQSVKQTLLPFPSFTFSSHFFHHSFFFLHCTPCCSSCRVPVEKDCCPIASLSRLCPCSSPSSPE